MPPDAVIWLVGTLSVAVMGGVSAVSVAMIRRSNSQLTKADLAELRRDMRADLAEVKNDVKRLGDKLDTHITYSHGGTTDH